MRFLTFFKAILLVICVSLAAPLSAQGSDPCKSGSFSQEEIIPVGQTPVSVAVADFDNDSREDLAIANSGSNDVSVVLRPQ